MRRVWAVCVLASVAAGCGGEAEAPAETMQDGALSEASNEVRHAQHFELSRRDGYTVVRTFGEITSFQTKDEGTPVQDVTVLVPRGHEPPVLEGELAGAYVVEVPARSVAVNNDDLMTFVIELGASDRLVAVGGFYTYDDAIRDAVERDALGELGYSWHLPPDMEVLLTRDPEIAFMGMDAPDNVPALQRSRELGIGAVPAFVWAERDPLARAEWIKFFGAFLGLDDEARELFDGIESRYMALKARTAAVVDSPSVLWGYHAGDDRWFMMTNNIESRLVRDAGALGVLTDHEGPVRYDGSEFASEAVLVAGAEADHWVIGDIHQNALPPTAFMNEFHSYREDALYHNYARTKWDVNAYDWYEGGVVRPDDILADLIHLFHPELSPDRELVFMGHFDKEVGR
ncbi:MAG: ABC transporter substrate-binding protein [Gemmatimonadota bacterium]